MWNLDEGLGAENGKESQLRGVLGSRLGGVHHDAQVRPGNAEHVAVQRHGADLRMVDGLSRPFRCAHSSGIPQLGEMAAVGSKLGDRAPDPLICGISVGRGPQRRHLRGLEGQK